MWEYRIERPNGQASDDEMHQRLNYLGEQGWELVAVELVSNDRFGVMIFKRPKKLPPA